VEAGCVLVVLVVTRGGDGQHVVVDRDLDVLLSFMVVVGL
jgi:hypothetical protein